MLHTRNVAKAQNYRVRFFPQNNWIYSYYVLFKIRRIGFWRIGTKLSKRR